MLIHQFNLIDISQFHFWNIVDYYDSLVVFHATFFSYRFVTYFEPHGFEYLRIFTVISRISEAEQRITIDLKKIDTLIYNAVAFSVISMFARLFISKSLRCVCVCVCVCVCARACVCACVCACVYI